MQKFDIKILQKLFQLKHFQPFHFVYIIFSIVWSLDYPD